jgi:hypothetical protein
MTSGWCIVLKGEWNSASRALRSSPCAPQTLAKRPEREKSDNARERRNPVVSLGHQVLECDSEGLVA